jgi:hypothetical protein
MLPRLKVAYQDTNQKDADYKLETMELIERYNLRGQQFELSSLLWSKECRTCRLRRINKRNGPS